MRLQTVAKRFDEVATSKIKFIFLYMVYRQV